MDKRTFKLSVIRLLEHDVDGLSSEKKIKYMKKWIRDYELENQKPNEETHIQEQIKVGILVRTTIKKIIRLNLLSEEKIKLLQDSKYSKETFDINYPFLKKVVWNSPISDQGKVEGYGRYWVDEEIINGERFLICSQWYERNKPKFIKWAKDFEK